MEKEKNNIDHFFRESLRDHEILPSAKAKEAFLKEASGIAPGDKTIRRILPYLILAAVISAGTLLFLYFRNAGDSQQPIASNQLSAVSSQQSAVSNQRAAVSSMEPSVSSPQSSTVNTRADLNSKTQNSSSNHKKENKSTNYLAAVENPVTEIAATGYSITTESEPKVPVGGESSEPKVEEANPITITGNTEPSTVPDSLINQPEKKKDTIESAPPAPPVEEKKTPTNKEWYLSMAAQYSPEYMFNTLEDGKFVNNFGIEGIFIFGKYSVRTGIGISIGKGTNELAVEYNDYLGSFMNLDSMSFTWDGGIQDYLPNYYLSNQEVWDSLMSIDSLKVVKRYTYLQIPLVLGYDFIHTEKFSLGFRAGPMLSLLVNTKQLSDEYDPGKKKIIKVNNITPGQVDLNWQLMAGINASLRISRRFLFELEPMAKYYFNSVYEKPDISKKPWSIGIRAALLIKLY